MRNHTDCICLTFLHCVRWKVALNCQKGIQLVSLLCVRWKWKSTLNQTGIQLVNKPFYGPPKRIQSHTACICLTFLQCVRDEKCLWIVKLASDWSTRPSLACPRGCKVTLIPFVWDEKFLWIVKLASNWSTSPHMARPKECKVTLLAFVWLFSIVWGEMCQKCLWIVNLASNWSTSPHMACPSHTDSICLTFLHWSNWSNWSTGPSAWSVSLLHLSSVPVLQWPTSLWKPLRLYFELCNLFKELFLRTDCNLLYIIRVKPNQLMTMNCTWWTYVL